METCFRDLKEVVGAGQQQVRFVWANIGAFHVCAWTLTMTEAWARPEEELVRHRSASPWDDDPSALRGATVSEKAIAGIEAAVGVSLPDHYHRFPTDHAEALQAAKKEFPMRPVLYFAPSDITAIDKGLWDHLRMSTEPAGRVSYAACRLTPSRQSSR